MILYYTALCVRNVAKVADFENRVVLSSPIVILIFRKFLVEDPGIKGGPF